MPEAAEPDADADEEADADADADADAGPASVLPLPCLWALSARAASAGGPSGQLRCELSSGWPLICFFISWSCASVAASSPCLTRGAGSV
jgi:hypothetical protein